MLLPALNTRGCTHTSTAASPTGDQIQAVGSRECTGSINVTGMATSIPTATDNPSTIIIVATAFRAGTS